MASHPRVAFRSPRTAVLAAALITAMSCASDDDGSTTGNTNPGGGDPPVTVLRLNEVSHGFGQILPHVVPRPGTNDLVAIRRFEDLVENVNRSNPILPTPSLPDQAIAPDGTPGNHFLFANFTLPFDPFDVLSPSGTSSGLDGAVTVTALNPITGVSLDVPGRAFVGGQTIVLAGGQPQLETWATLDSSTGMLVANPAIPGRTECGNYSLPRKKTKSPLVWSGFEKYVGVSVTPSSW